MSRLRAATLVATLALAACRIERTPQEYVDHQTPTAREREAVAEEIEDRVQALGQAVSRGNARDALDAFSPAPDAYAFGPVEGLTLHGAEQIDSALSRLAEGRTGVEMREVEVGVGPLANVAWFSALVEVPGSAALAGRELRATGVYVRDEGDWQLVQAHLSLPAELSRLQQSPDSAGGPPAGAAPAADTSTRGDGS